jgi:hypothetical protein
VVREWRRCVCMCVCVCVCVFSGGRGDVDRGGVGGASASVEEWCGKGYDEGHITKFVQFPTRALGGLTVGRARAIDTS